MGSVRLPPMSIWAVRLCRKSLIHAIMSGPKLSALRVLKMKVCEMLSNAFLKSITSMRFDSFLVMVMFMRFIMFNMQLPMFFSDV